VDLTKGNRRTGWNIPAGVFVSTWVGRLARALGDWPKQSYQIAQDFRLPARRGKRRIVALCNPFRNAAGGRKDKQAGNFEIALGNVSVLDDKQEPVRF
jgi:hypothetical protein